MFEVENETFAIFDGLLDNFGKKYEKMPKDHWSISYFSLDAQPKIQILNGFYYLGIG